MHACSYPNHLFTCAHKFNEQTTCLCASVGKTIWWINIRGRVMFPRKDGLVIGKNIVIFLCVDMRIGTNNVLWCVCLYLGLFLFCVVMCVSAVGQHNGNDWSCLPQPAIARKPRQNILRQARLYLLLSLLDVRWKRCHNTGKWQSCSMKSRNVGGTIHTFTTKHQRDAKALKPRDNWPRLLEGKPKTAKGRDCQNTSWLMADVSNVGNL